MAQKKDGTPKVAKATKKVSKKAVIKKSVKKSATKAPPKPEEATAPAVPSYILRLQDDAAPKDFSYLGFANTAWGLVWRPDRRPQDRSLYRQPLFTLTGPFGSRLIDFRAGVLHGRRTIATSVNMDRDVLRDFKHRADDFRGLDTLLLETHNRANLRWTQLWTLDDLDCLNPFGEPDDTVLGDVDFVVWVELLLMVEEVSDLFRGTNSDIWGGMEYSSWLEPQGPGMLLLTYLREAGASRINFTSTKFDFPRIFTTNDFVADQTLLIKLREASGAIFGKIVEVLQSPAMESRFRAFFGGLASELNITPEELWNAMYDMSKSSYGDGTYMPLLVAKLGQVFGLLKDYDETPLTLTSALEQWVGWIRDVPKGGWPIGEKYEAKANSERLKLIADATRKGRVEAPEPAKKRIF